VRASTVPVVDNEGPLTSAVTADLSEIMGRVARTLQQQQGDVAATLEAISAAAVANVPGADGCSISYILARRRVEPRAWTGDRFRDIDQLQSRVQQGPCLDAVWKHRTVRIDDMTTDRRWPRFAPEAAKLGAASSLSFQLFVVGDNLGALNLYSGSPHAFCAESEDVGLVFASHAAVALIGARQQEHLRTAVRSRDLLGQAKGILMERYKLTADQAFDLLARVSQHTNRKMVDLARELTETGTMPEV
jgi:GAF domain-containing protein